MGVWLCSAWFLRGPVMRIMHTHMLLCDGFYVTLGKDWMGLFLPNFPICVLYPFVPSRDGFQYLYVCLCFVGLILQLF